MVLIRGGYNTGIKVRYSEIKEKKVFFLCISLDLHYLCMRTLPLHHSQQELESGEITHGDSSTSPYTDFSFDIRPTDDFLNELMKFGIEVLQPFDLREKMHHRVLEMYHYYEQNDGE